MIKFNSKIVREEGMLYRQPSNEFRLVYIKGHYDNMVKDSKKVFCCVYHGLNHDHERLVIYHIIS